MINNLKYKKYFENFYIIYKETRFPPLSFLANLIPENNGKPFS